MRRDARRNEGGQFIAIVEHWSISGFAQAATSSLLTAALNAMEGGYRIQGQNCGLFYDDGTASFHGVVSGNTLGGTRVTVLPSFPVGGAGTAELSTFRSYSIELEWELPLGSNPGNVMISFHERLSFEGTGGPEFGYLPVTEGVPPKQLLQQVTPVRITQAGSAVGYLAYPPPMPPLYPDSVHAQTSKLSRGEPRRVGPFGSPNWTDFPIEWSYDMEIAEGVDFSALPNRWIN
jgi:hypothetical protein